MVIDKLKNTFVREDSEKLSYPENILNTPTTIYIS